MFAIKILVLASFVLTHSYAHRMYRIFQNSKGALDFNNGTLIITCNQENPITGVFPTIDYIKLTVETVAISQCRLTETPLAETLKAMNVNTSTVHNLHFNYVDIGTAGDNFTAGLTIENLEIFNKRKLNNITYDFLQTLSNLTVLNISGVELQSLPRSLRKLGIYRDTSILSWDGCENLRELTIFNVPSRKQFPELWPKNCSQLNELKMLTMNEETSRFLVDTVVASSPNLQSLSMQGCKLRDISFELPSNIVNLDLRYNRISRLSREQSSQLFGTQERRIWFGGNPVNCKCENNRMLEALHMNQSQMVDYNELICLDSKFHLSSVSVSEVCRLVVMSNLEYGMGYVWGLCCSISVFSVVLLVLTRRYGPIVRTILYSRGYCESCLKDGIDADRPYDAFLSFAHGDDEFVLDQLLPKLEDTPNEFHVCMHYRDWTIGEWIPAQIMQSVRLSKRTIIVLSKNFVKSWWGVLEFRYAHASAMAEGRSRLLVLILDDVLSEKLQPELQGYLEYHTFLRCNDPFFWDKLRYAMPHRNNTIETI